MVEWQLEDIIHGPTDRSVQQETRRGGEQHRDAQFDDVSPRQCEKQLESNGKQNNTKGTNELKVDRALNEISFSSLP